MNQNYFRLLLAVTLCALASLAGAQGPTNYQVLPTTSLARVQNTVVLIDDAPTSGTTAAPGTLYRTAALSTDLQTGDSFSISLNEPRSLSYRVEDTTGSTLGVRLRVFGNSPWGALNSRTNLVLTGTGAFVPTGAITTYPPDVVIEDITTAGDGWIKGEQVFAAGTVTVYVVSITNAANNDILHISKYGAWSPTIMASASDVTSIVYDNGSAITAFSPAATGFSADWANVFDGDTGAIYPNDFLVFTTGTISLNLSTSYTRNTNGFKGNPTKLISILTE